MQLNSKGKLARFYMWLPPEDKKLPQDFCTFFWGLVGRAFFVFVVGGAVLAFLVSGIVLSIIHLSSFIWAHKMQTLFVLGSLLFCALLIWFSERKEKIKIELLSEAKMIFRGKIDAVKKRYCPRVEWK